MKLLVYALGGGLGHLTRSIAFAQIAVRRGHAVQILSNSPYGSALLDIASEHLPEQLAVTLLPHDGEAAEVRHAVQDLVICSQHDVLVVDTFPRGIGGELPTIFQRCCRPRYLVHRTLPARYVAERDLFSWASRHYQRMFMPGESANFEDASNAHATAPWFLCASKDLLGREEARRRLGSPSECDLPCVLVLGCGRFEEEEQFERCSVKLAELLQGRAYVRFASLREQTNRPASVRYWPTLKLLRGVDLLVGAGGYNTVQEARATSTPLLALPQKRLYDDQYHRLQEHERVDSFQGLLQRVVRFIDESREVSVQRPIHYDNGASEAMAWIERDQGTSTRMR